MDKNNNLGYIQGVLVLSLLFFSGCKLEKQSSHDATTPTSADSPPIVAVSDSVSTPVNTAIVIQVLNNDNGVLLGTGYNMAISTSPNNGTATVNLDSSITYSPNSSFIGIDSFQYVLTDSKGNSSYANVTIRVDCQNCNSMATISWQPPQEQNIAGYYIYHGNQSRIYPERIWVGNTQNFNYTNLSSGAHYFSVTTVTSNGEESAHSLEAMVSVH